MKVIEEVEQQIKGTMSNATVGEILTKTENVEDWLKDIRNYALEQVLNGENIQENKANTSGDIVAEEER